MKKRTLATLLLALASSILLAIPAAGIDLGRIAAMPEAEQLREPVQGELQKWFTGRVQAYMDEVKGTEIGRSPLVSPGDPERFRSILARPGSNGSFRIVLRKGIERPVTLTGGLGGDLFAFPAGNPEGTTTTAWHESMHALLSRTGLEFDPSPWAAVQRLGNPEAYDRESVGSKRDHVMIEQAAEKIFLWLSGLGDFEKEVAKAVEKRDSLKKGGLSTAYNTYEVERQVWGQAHVRWKLIWKSSGDAITAGNRSPQVPQSLRDILRDAAGVRAPFTEEVIGFYMKKGVPEWVLQADETVMPVLIRENTQEAPPRVTKDVCEGGFSFNVVEGRSWFPVIQSGRLSVWLDVPFRENISASMELGGKNIPFGRMANGSYGLEVDMGQARSAILNGGTHPFKVKIRVKNPADAMKERVVAIPVHVLYKGGSQKGGSAYLPTEGIFVLKLRLENQPSGSSAGSSPAAGTTGGVPASGLGGAWRVNPNPDTSKAPAYTTNRWSLMKMKDGQDSIQSIAYVSEYTAVQYADTIWDNLRKTAEPAKTSLGAATTYLDKGGRAVYVRSGNTILTVESGLYVYGGVTEADVARASWEVAEAFARQLKGAAPKPATSQALPAASLVRQDTAKAEKNPALDEEPPKIGEVHKVIELRDPPTGGKSRQESAETWYLHPEKAYRFRIPSSWKVVEKRDGADIDRLISEKRSPFLMIEASRKGWVSGESNFLSNVEAELLKSTPKGRFLDMRLGGIGCRVFAEDMRGKNDLTLWHVLFPRQKEIYYIAVVSDMVSDHSRLPRDAKAALDSIEFLSR